MLKKVCNSTDPAMIEWHSEKQIYQHAITRRLRQIFLLTCFSSLLIFSATDAVWAQNRDTHTLFGDLKVDESKVSGIKPLSFDVILYSISGVVVGRQTVPNNGRYRFLGIANGEYDIVIEVENNEVARIRISLNSPFKNDFRQDIALEWRADFPRKQPEKAGADSVADYYTRSSANKNRFKKAEEAIDKKSYDQALALLRQIVSEDAKDFQAWTELGTVYLAQKNFGEAEKAYQRAIEERPSFIQALMNLGRLRMAQKNYDGAVEPLSQAVTAQPQSADANFYLGEAYLRIKKGSKAVIYLNEAIRLDPIGKADAHLRLAALYNAAGLKDRAAAEYEQFLAKKPDYPEKKKLQQYITENKRP